VFKLLTQGDILVELGTSTTRHSSTLVSLHDENAALQHGKDMHNPGLVLYDIGNNLSVPTRRQWVAKR